MLMMARWRQRIPGDGNDLVAAPLAFIDPRMRRDGSWGVRRVEFGVGQVRQVVNVLVLRHFARGSRTLPACEEIRKVGEFLHSAGGAGAREIRKISELCFVETVINGKPMMTPLSIEGTAQRINSQQALLVVSPDGRIQFA